MRIFFATILIVGLSGCGQCSRTKAAFSGYDRLCINGISYLQFTSGVSVEYARTGEVKKCRTSTILGEDDY